MLINVLKRVAADTGFNHVSQREALLDLLQRSADRLHDMLECNSIMRECSLVVLPNAVVALPSYVGQLKGIRPFTYDVPFDVTAMRPRYVTSTLNYKKDNWRDLGFSPIHTDIETIGPLTIVSTVSEGATLIISGQTPTASKIEESIVLNGAPQVTTNLFGPTIFKIASLDPRTCDVYIKDENDVELAVLYNTDQQTMYKLVDVSQWFWSEETAAGETIVDVLFKVPKFVFANDTDSFYAGDEYDDAWYHMAMHYFYLPTENRKKDAQDEMAYAIVSTQSIKGSSEGDLVKRINFGRNKYYDLFGTSTVYPASCDKIP
jgi:hypothetical protein